MTGSRVETNRIALYPLPEGQKRCTDFVALLQQVFLREAAQLLQRWGLAAH